MAARINLQELEQELVRTKTMFDQWSSTLLTRAQGCKSAHTSKLLASKGEMTSLTERLQRAEKQAVQVRQQMVQDRQHEQALQATADSLIAEQHALQKRLQQLTTEFESNVEVVQQLQAEVDATRSDLDLRLSRLDQLHNAYQAALGLKLQSNDGEMYLEFTQIDPADPDRPFGFGVKVLGDAQYQVTRCEPELPQRSALEQQLLGAKPNFGGFVRAMRQRFKLLVATPSQQSPAAAATAAE